MWFYTATAGVQKLKQHPLLTTELALQLRKEGASRIELRWHWRRMQMRVTAGYHSVWGKGGPPGPDGITTPPADDIVPAA